MTDQKRVAKLSSGYDCPLVGYGTYQSMNAEQLKTAIKAAIHAGYRHIDTAFIYFNEHVVGEALQELYDAGVVKREDLFITTKLLGMHFGCAAEQLKTQLAKLRTSYVDLYLMHFPVSLAALKPGAMFPLTPGAEVPVDKNLRIEDAWPHMEECVQLGLARSIGVSNFNTNQVERLLKIAKVKPAMNQCESHPGFQNTKLVEFCQKNGVGFMAHSQFGSPGTKARPDGKVFCDINLLEDKRLLDIGAKYGKNAAHVILRWQIQRGVFVIPKSTTPSRIADNFNVWDFELTQDDMKAIAAIDTNVRCSWFEVPGINDHPDYPHVEAGSC